MKTPSLLTECEKGLCHGLIYWNVFRLTKNTKGPLNIDSLWLQTINLWVKGFVTLTTYARDKNKKRKSFELSFPVQDFVFKLSHPWTLARHNKPISKANAPWGERKQ